MTPLDPYDLQAQFAVEANVLTRAQFTQLVGMNTAPHPQCQRPDFCRGYSQLGLCLSCRGEAREGE